MLSFALEGITSLERQTNPDYYMDWFLGFFDQHYYVDLYCLPLFYGGDCDWMGQCSDFGLGNWRSFAPFHWSGWRVCWKIYLETKSRPRYLVADYLNNEGEDNVEK